MRDTMTYGGPDDAGFYVSRKKDVALGHRRLSIIDLSEGGHQPKKDGKRKVWLVYNGEIYNYREIQKELEEKGCSFSSTSDSEVILTAFRVWGMRCLEKFRGMFAFCLWDEEEEKLILARDRAGVKPLYYSFQNGVFLFASELKAFSRFPGFQKEINFDALLLFLQFGYITAPYSIFKNVHKLEPGHYLELDREGNSKKVRYWDVADFYRQPRLIRDEKEVEEELERLLVKCFQYRMVADVPVGVFLSGGVDSSAVTALLQKNMSSRLKTFTIGFNETGYDEAPFARQVASHLRTDHTELTCTTDHIFDILEQFEQIYDEPFGDSSGLPTYLVARLARKQVKVALSADGGDEVFAGYTKYEIAEKYFRTLSRVPALLRIFSSRVLELLSPLFVERFYELLCRFLPLPRFMNLKDKFHKFRNILREDKLSEIFRMSGSYARPDQIRALLLHAGQGGLQTPFDNGSCGSCADSFSAMQCIDFKTYMADDILVKVDRATMQNSLEGREPFLDQELVEYMARLPAHYKNRNGRSKYILKKILSRHLPPGFLDRPKMGFGIPIYTWLRKNIIKKESDEFSPAFLRKQQIFRTPGMRSLIDDFTGGRAVNPHFVWFMFVFQRWHRKWM